MVNVCTPYRSDKNLGLAYNETISLYPANSWICLIDHDVMFLTPDAIRHIEKYTEKYPDTGIFTCFTNRLHPQSKGQLLGNICSENDSIREHIDIAEARKKSLYQVTPLQNNIGGFLMVINKATWERIKFKEGIKCLGVDTEFSLRVLQAGLKILRMDAIYIFHTYRMIGGYKAKDHLK